MSRGLGVVQRRVLDTLKNIEANFAGAWVLRRGLVVPKEGQRVERSDRSSTVRAINGLLSRGLIEAATALYSDGDSSGGIEIVVRLHNPDRHPPLTHGQDAELATALESQAYIVNSDLRSCGSRYRVRIVRVETIEPELVYDIPTMKPYRVVWLNPPWPQQAWTEPCRPEITSP